MKCNLYKFCTLFICLFFILHAEALIQVLKIQNARELTKKEIEFFPEKIPEKCHPIMVEVYVNDEMIKQIKMEINMTHDDFFKKELNGNKILFTYFPKRCRTKRDMYLTGTYLKIKNEVEDWLIFNKPK